MNNFTEKVHLTIPAIFGYEDMPAAVAQVWARKMGASQEKADKAKLAVMEICLNAIEHGSHNNPQKVVTIDLFEQSENTLIIEISDTGKGFMPKIPKEFPPTQANRRGFGIFMVYKLVDEVEFPPSNEGTLVRIKIKAEKTT
ncbi:ATP-binding protein [Candidatus Parabeggiatoa sp. HSG14]|uniref:ATP-binding protein n=1 Tax=Candidatus Parabeggiatoa sp. HSG14 TaxID=3055593 RepID=UPI0025A7A6F9|nr:ATP-binding protein [Thiotrichales bacterium HSG14]